jgi:hypothetical protein
MAHGAHTRFDVAAEGDGRAAAPHRGSDEHTVRAHRRASSCAQRAGAPGGSDADAARSVTHRQAHTSEAVNRPEPTAMAAARLIALVALLLAGAVRAAPPPPTARAADRARTHYDAGYRFLDEGRVVDALRAFEAAYADYTRYLDVAPRGSKASLVRERLEVLRAPAVVLPDAAVETADGGAPPPDAAAPTAPDHGADATQYSSIANSAVVAAPAPSTARRRPRWIGWAVGGSVVAAVAIIVGVTLGVVLGRPRLDANLPPFGPDAPRP